MTRHPWLGLRPWQRHSMVVGTGGLVYVVYGLYFTIAPVNPARERSLGLLALIPNVPLAVWGIVWVAIGGLAIVSTRWPPANETWGYTTMSGLATLWACAYATAMPLGAPSSNVGGVIVWGLVAFLWWGVAGLRNPETPRRRTGRVTADEGD